MGCGCSKGATTTRPTYVVTLADGSKKVYRSEIEAAAAAERNGGTYEKQ